MIALAASQSLRNYLEYSRIGFVNILAFRLRYYTGVATYLINVTVYYFIWKALYAADAEFALDFTFGDMITYVAVGWVIRSVYFNNIDQNMASDVMEGTIALSMLKPVTIQARYIGQALGEAGFRLLLLTMPTALAITLIFPVQTPAGTGYFLLFLVSLMGSVLLMATLNFLIGTCAVRLKSILGLLRAKFIVIELLSGLLVPITMFPLVLQDVFSFLPFQHIAYTPLRIYLGKLSFAEVQEALLVQAVWLLVLTSLGSFSWKAMSRKITIHGG